MTLVFHIFYQNSSSNNSCIKEPYCCWYCEVYVGDGVGWRDGQRPETRQCSDPGDILGLGPSPVGRWSGAWSWLSAFTRCHHHHFSDLERPCTQCGEWGRFPVSFIVMTASAELGGAGWLQYTHTPVQTPWARSICRNWNQSQIQMQWNYQLHSFAELKPVSVIWWNRQQNRRQCQFHGFTSKAVKVWTNNYKNKEIKIGNENCEWWWNLFSGRLS